MALRIRITPEGYERLKAERDLDQERLEEATRILQELPGSSDDYDDSGLEDAKTEKSRIEQRIARLEEQIARAEIIDEPASAERIDLGSTATLDASGEEFVVQLVSSVESGVLDGDIPRVSDESPLGRTLVGRRVGDKFKVEINGRVTEYTVKAIG